MVDITYKCFADDETINAITGVIAAHDQENIIGLTEFPTIEAKLRKWFQDRGADECRDGHNMVFEDRDGFNVIELALMVKTMVAEGR